MSVAVVTSLELSDILPSTTNPRKSFDPIALEQLAQSIKEIGITVPLLVRPMHDPDDGELLEYRLVSGHRRLRAAALAGLEKVPAIVREMTDAEALDVQMVENLQRADLHPLDEAAGYRALINAAAGRGVSLSQEELSHKVGKTLSYVAQRIKLLDAIPVVQKAFLEGMIHIGHALVLARLQPDMQEKALRYTVDPWYCGRGKSIEDLVDELLASTKPDPELEDGEFDNVTAIDTIAQPVSKLKQWVEDNVTLDLKNAPWNLADERLLESAGACTKCDKRTGANPALFAEFTAAGDSCMDPACFGEKKKAFIEITLKAAEKQGKPLPKLTNAYGNDKLDGTEKVLKQGQWVEAEEGSCPHVAKGLMTNGENAGSILTVCANQKCKVHKHHVYEAPSRSAPSAPKPPKGMSQEEHKAQQEREEKREAAEQRALYFAVREAYARSVEREEALLQYVERGIDNQNIEDIDQVFEINGWKHEGGWRDGYADLQKKLRSLDGVALIAYVFDLMHGDLWDVDSYRDPLPELKKLAAKYEVDEPAVKQKVMDDNPKLYDEPKPKEPAKAPAKKSAKKTSKKAAKKATEPKPAKAADRKSAAAGDDDDEEDLDAIAAGTCRFCGCTEDNACEGGCCWVDPFETVCSNDECVAKYEAEQGYDEGEE